MTEKDKPDLDAAYALRSPDDSRRLYAEWADSYEPDFVAGQDYRLHRHVARHFHEAGGRGPVLDVGAGTGICGVALAEYGAAPIDGTDISGEMLQEAAQKQVYRDLFVADVTRPLPAPEAPYRGIVSSGTFTTGHVGPDALDNLLAIAGPEALFALSVNAAHFRSAGFEAKLTDLRHRIAEIARPEVRIYGPGAEGPHRDDTALILLFRVV